MSQAARDRAQLRVAIAGGGTGGHVTPALAIADAFVRAGLPAPLFIGTAHGLEARLVPARGYELAVVAGSRLVGTGLVGKLRGAWSLLRGILAARGILRAGKVRCVIGVGGYASGAALLAARSMGIATAVHESNAVPGLTNKVLGRIVGRSYLGFEAAQPDFPARSSVLVGNPVRPEIAAIARQRSLPAPDARPVRFLVVGGSQGSQFLNEQVPGLLATLAPRLRDAGRSLVVVHQVGKLEPGPVAERYRALGVEAEVVGYIDDMAGRLDAADFAITRSGSGTTAELSAAGLPALLVPFPFAAGDHQAANAAAFCAEGAGTWCRQDDWEAQKLASAIAPLLTDNVLYDRASRAARAAGRSDAADALVRDCLQWLEAKR